MDLLKQEIERKRKQIEEKSVLMGPDKKYFKRGDLAAKDAEEYWKLHKRLKTANGDSDSEEKESNHLKSDTEQTINLTRKEVIRRLKERDEPTRLFGETDFDSFQRLRRLEILEPDVNKGFKNDFQDAMDKVDEDFLKELLKSTMSCTTTAEEGETSTEGGTEVKVVHADVKVKDDGTTYEEIMKMSENFGKGDESLDAKVILKFLKLILNLWGEELNNRTNDVKRSLKGKVASATHMQTVAYIKPLFRRLKKQQVSSDIFICLVDIVKHLLEREYIKASEAYLEMAIGNAPWPIGVTMVGIHARTGREKIHSKNVAHVLNDENQRKYIQGMKRLMTQAQKYFPNDPSKMVNYNPEKKSK